MRGASIQNPIEPRSRRPRAAVRLLSGGLAALVLSLALGLAAGSAAAADEPWPGRDYRATRAGHPLRIAAYLVHPVGVVLDYAIMRPAYWVGQREPWRTIFGVRP